MHSIGHLHALNFLKSIPGMLLAEVDLPTKSKRSYVNPIPKDGKTSSDNRKGTRTHRRQTACQTLRLSEWAGLSFGISDLTSIATENKDLGRARRSSTRVKSVEWWKISPKIAQLSHCFIYFDMIVEVHPTAHKTQHLRWSKVKKSVEFRAISERKSDPL